MDTKRWFRLWHKLVSSSLGMWRFLSVRTLFSNFLKKVVARTFKRTYRIARMEEMSMRYEVFNPDDGFTIFTTRFELAARFVSWLCGLDYAVAGKGWL